ncbi:MAG: hypothetical protein ACOZAA_04245 [Pseudomonadota bacterium]
MRITVLAVATGAALFTAACVHDGASADLSSPAPRNILPVNADVTISEDGAGGYSFSYKAPFADEKGNFDFSINGAAFNTIRLSFTIADASVAGIKFKSDATDAMWIVEKTNADKATGSPSGPYRGSQFSNFEVSADGRQLTVTDTNDDGVLYRYGLRFDLDGKTVIDDPDAQNGGNH